MCYTTRTAVTKEKGGESIMNKVITVSREFGSGGRELGVKLAGGAGDSVFMTRN